MRIPVTLRQFLRDPNRRSAGALALTVRRRARSRVARYTGLMREAPLDPATAPDAEVVVYFGDRPEKLYQLQQWLPVLDRLHPHHPVLLVLRNQHSLLALRTVTTLPAVCPRRLNDLVQLYQGHEYKVAIYVNNGARNFQSLSAAKLLHVHVNHGESDKISMVSNTAKAYDRVFVAGEAAVQRHRAALLGFDESRLVRVGRPQLDLSPPPALPASPRRTIIYAPTWGGEEELNNYTSVDHYGAQIARAVLAQPSVRFIYKPHPRIADSTDAGIRAGHAAIRQAIRTANAADPVAGHAMLTSVDVLALFEHCHLMVTDVSSVGLDFLYRRPDVPLFLTDRRNDRTALLRDAPVSACADIIDAGSLDGLTDRIAARLSQDELTSQRLRVRQHYFDGLEPGESTARFVAAISTVVKERDEMHEGRRPTTIGGEALEE